MNADAAEDNGRALRHLYLVDGSGYIFRAYHGLPPMSRSDGTPVNAVYGFTTMLIKLIENAEADHLAVIFDAGKTSFRNDIYPEYKAQRPDPPEDLIPQFGLIRDAVRAFGVPCVELPGYEADDLIATYARLALEKGARVTIVSSDKDLMQLVRDGVAMLDPMKNRHIGPAEVMEKFGVAPDKVVDVQALAGDSVDNVPGIPGIGVKTAAQLIGEYGDLETLLARAGEIKQPKRRESLLSGAEAARISRELVRLREDVAVPVPVEDLDKPRPDPATLLDFLRRQEFKSLVARMETLHGTGDAGAAVEAAPLAVDRSAYELITSLSALDVWIAEAREAGIIALDTETDSLNEMRARMVGISMATAPGRACYIPLRHGKLGHGGLNLDGPPPEQLEVGAALARLAPLLSDRSILKVGHNIKYDLHIFLNEGVTVAPIDDSMVLSYVLDGSTHGHGMDELSRLHLGHAPITYEQVCGKGASAITFDRVPLDKALAYAAEDADVTLRLYRFLRERLLREKLVSVHETLDRPLIPVLLQMEREGIQVDRNRLSQLSADFAQRMAALEAEIQELAGETFNVGSPKQLGEILFEKMSLPGGKKSSKTGAWTTDADTLEALAAQGHDLPARVLDWRQLAKLKSTYTDALIQTINPTTGRVHTSYSQTVASTGRLASYDPNLQNIPVRTEEGRKIRGAFTAAPGHVLLSADYSQIELRLVAHVAGVEALKAAFHRGEDIHAATASAMFHVPVEGMDPMIRRRAKAINFGIIYGISAFGLANQLGIPRDEAKAFIDSYFQRFPEIVAYMERTKEFARIHGFVTTPFGRKCYTPGIKDKNPSMRSFAERAAINAPLQGGAADIIKRAMVRLPKALRREGLNARMLLQVHDELLFEVPEDEVEPTRTLARSVMEGAAHLSVPLVVDTGTGATWDAAH